MARKPMLARDTDNTIIQAGAIPYRVLSDGRVQVLLITNRAGAWIIPKGKIDPGHTAEQAARIEALEEAGVVGTTVGPEVGFYEYEKFDRLHRVRLFAMQVQRLLEDWHEREERQREWVSVDEAIRRVEFPKLRDVIERFERFEKTDAA